MAASFTSHPAPTPAPGSDPACRRVIVLLRVFLLALATLAMAAVALASTHLAAAAAAAPRAAATAETRRIGAALDAWAKPLIARGHLSGRLLLARHGEVLIERSWGMANAELGVPNGPDTRFCIASITKPMTVILATQLILEGKLAMSDTVGKWLPGFPESGRMTVEHLLRHRSGIPHRVTTDTTEALPRTAADMVELARHAKLEFEPGSTYSYSSGGFAVLARVLEIVDGRTYREMLAARLLDPVGMTETGHYDYRERVAGRASSYVPNASGFENAPLKDHSFLVGAGSVWSTTRDLHLLVQAVVTGKLGEGPRQSWVRNGRLNWNGSTNGFRAYADWDSATGIEVVFTGNQHSGANDLLRDAARRIAAGESPAPVPALPTPVAANDADLRRHEAVYALPNGPRLHVTARDGVLWANDWILVPIGEQRFHCPRDYAEVTVVSAADGTPERLDWKIGAQSFPCPRVDATPGR